MDANPRYYPRHYGGVQGSSGDTVGVRAAIDPMLGDYPLLPPPHPPPPGYNGRSGIMASRSLGASANDPTSRGTWIYLPPPPLPPPEYNEQSSMMTSSGGSASDGDSANDPTLGFYPYLPPPGHINDGMQGSSGCTVCMFYSYAINTILKDKVNVNISINLNAK